MAAVDPTRSTRDPVIDRAAERQHQDLLEAAWAVRDAAEVRRKMIRMALENLAAGLCAFEINAKRLSITEMDDNALYQFIGNTAKEKIDAGVWYRLQYENGVTAASRANTQAVKDLTDKLNQAQRDLSAANRRNTDLQADLNILRAEHAQANQRFQAIDDAKRRAENIAADLQQQISNLTAQLGQASARSSSEAVQLAPTAGVSDGRTDA